MNSVTDLLDTILMYSHELAKLGMYVRYDSEP